MFFAVISIMPYMFTAIRDFGITSRAIQQGKVQVNCINPRDFAKDNYRRIDDRPYGGGPGMVMTPEPLAKAIDYAKQLAKENGCSMSPEACPVVYLSPQGERLSESVVISLASTSVNGGIVDGMILLCGRYEGIDERLLAKYVDREISIGDYVLTGGELPAMVLMDSVIRRLPDVMGDDKSAQQDSFVDGLLDCPHYTKPVSFEDELVPEVLLSGHHANIEKWRFIQQVKRTQALRPDLWQAYTPTKQQSIWLSQAKKSDE